MILTHCDTTVKRYYAASERRSKLGSPLQGRNSLSFSEAVALSGSQVFVVLGTAAWPINRYTFRSIVLT